MRTTAEPLKTDVANPFNIAACDRLDDLRGQKRERHEPADMALGETFGRSDFVERCGLAGEDRIHPAARTRDCLQQGVLRSWIDGPVLCRRMRDPFHRGALERKGDCQLGWGGRL